MPAEQMQMQAPERMETVRLEEQRVQTEQPRTQEPMSTDVSLRGGGLGECLAGICACDMCLHCCC
jgi:hypothetical protein